MVRTVLVALIVGMSALSSTAQTPSVEPGVSLELAKWRAARYSDVRYKLNLTLEKMSPVLKGTIEIRVTVRPPASGAATPPVNVKPGTQPSLPASSAATPPVNVTPGTQAPTSASIAETPPVNVTPGTQASSPASSPGADVLSPIILDWRKLRGHEEKSTISNVTVNGTAAVRSFSFSWPPVEAQASPGNSGPPKGGTPSFAEHNEHLIFRDGVVVGENVIRLDFTSPILTSGSAITRYVDKEDGSEYIYSLFVPSDASTAFPVFDQPDIKARV